MEQTCFDCIFGISELERTLLCRLSKLFEKCTSLKKQKDKPTFYGVRRVSSRCSSASRENIIAQQKKAPRFRNCFDDFDEITVYRPHLYHIKPYNYV